MKKFYSLFLLTFIGMGVYAQTTYTLASGCTIGSGGCTWNVGASWVGGVVPTSGSSSNNIIVIPTGLRVNIAVNEVLNNITLRIYGTLALNNGRELTLNGNSSIGGAAGATEILANGGSKITVGGGTPITGGSSFSGPFVHTASGFFCSNCPQGGQGSAYTSANNNTLSAILPVKLTSFTATTSNAFVNINWETAQESNNSHFELQRSANGNDWSTITTVAGKGTTYSVSTYAYTDKTPLNDNSFYRLKQVDFDNKFEISKVVAVKLSSKGSLAFDILPNRVVTNFKVVASTDLRTTDISIFNTVGNRINATISKNGNEANVDVTSLSAGQYLIRIQKGSETMTKRFVIIK